MEDERIPPPPPKKVLNGKFHNKKAGGKTKNKMGGRRPEGHVTYPGNKRMEEASRGQGRMEASCDGGPGPRRGCIVIGGWMVRRE